MPHYDAVYDRVGNILLTRLMGADSRLVDDGFDIGIRKSWEGRHELGAGCRRCALWDLRRVRPSTSMAGLVMSASPKR